jgi:type II secretory pathway component PulM
MQLMENLVMVFGALLLAVTFFELLVTPFVALFRAKKQPIPLTKRQMTARDRLILAGIAMAMLGLATWWLGRDLWW